LDNAVFEVELDFKYLVLHDCSNPNLIE